MNHFVQHYVDTFVTNYKSTYFDGL